MFTIKEIARSCMSRFRTYLIRVCIGAFSFSVAHAQFFVEYSPRFTIYTIRGETKSGGATNASDPDINLSKALARLRFDHLSAGFGYHLSDDESVVLSVCSSGDVQHTRHEPGWIYPSRYLGAQGNVVDTIVMVTDQFSYTQTVQYLFVEPQYRLKVSKNLRCRIGVAFGFLLSHQSTNSIQLVSPKALTWKSLPDSLIVRTGSFEKWLGPMATAPSSFLNGDREAVYDDASSGQFRSLRLGLNLGLQYSIALDDALSLVPSLSYEYGLNSQFNDGRMASLSMLRFGAALQWDI